MNAPIARATLLLITAFPVQRAMLGVAAALMTIAIVLMLAFAPDAEPQRVAGALLPLVVLGVFPTIFAAGFVFLSVSASRISVLLPHFRRRMLIALALAVAASFGPLAGVVLGTGKDNALVGVAIASLVMTCFTVCWALPFSWLGRAAIAGVLLFKLAEWLAARAHISIADNVPGVLAATVTAVIWLTFTVWYLRTPTIPRRPQLLSVLGLADSRQTPRQERYWAERLTPAAIERHARRLLQLGSPPLTPLMALLFPAILTAAFAIWMVPLAWLAGDTLTVPWHGIGFIITVAFYVNARWAAQGARQLWLVAGRRAEMFAAIERNFWREGAWPLLYFAALAGLLAVTAAGLPWPTLLVAGGLLGANALAASYLGFALIRPLGVLDVLLALLAAAGFVGSVSLVLTAPTAYGVATALLATLLGLAAAARAAARRRWPSIDWLQLRVNRLLLQRQRALGRSLDGTRDAVR